MLFALCSLCARGGGGLLFGVCETGDGVDSASGRQIRRVDGGRIPVCGAGGHAREGGEGRKGREEEEEKEEEGREMERERGGGWVGGRVGGG